MQLKSMLFGALATLLIAPAMAQDAPFNIFGLVDKIDGATLVVNADDSSVQAFKLAPNLLILQSRSVTLADIKSNDYVASAAVRREEGKLYSTEVRILPDALRGQGEGQRPMNDPRNQTMTNATVTGAVTLGGSNVLKVKFPQGESELIVEPGVPVTRIEAIGNDVLKNGMKIRIQGVRNAAGQIASRINVM